MSLKWTSQLPATLVNRAPGILKRPLGHVPFVLKANLIRPVLEYLFRDHARGGELDFLQDHWVGISVLDLGLEFDVSFQGQWRVRPRGETSVRFSAASPELLLIAAAKEDPDTLFFQRKLAIEGDTELGLEVKNLLLGVEFDSLPGPVRLALDKLATLVMHSREPELAGQH
ncbi:ubiquinone anaerobic biosynthesis accessory factor UbiT [Shewanella cyperi]|uniref:Ubiquinone biosynthesis accessory factor UbiT n=1 Tax=Shewanella cyperi TaxID=2814292 RepID=A0A975AL08_9GAMM|nr:SCP2 sterol-binding domain-containing protein [Shewanella cyperi]QSX30927.1 SCP2 sterol-binding domain-containing protein [Shewanella cyperi]QSX41706.1 SCP2 sterol-binding domain-containing protein [Shewanella cyperi]